MKLRKVMVMTALGTLLPLAGSSRAAAEEAAPVVIPEVLVLGVYHMANPGSDVANMEADDVLAPKRQAEIVGLIEVLERFRPTKIALEASFYKGDVISERYDAYLRAEQELNRNERQQVGFRLARKLGHETVYSVDADGDFPFLRLQHYAMTNGHEERWEALMGELNDKVAAQDAYLASHTVLETLLFMNSAEAVAEAMEFDYEMARFGEPWDWAGPDLVADWFRRNIHIYSNVVQLIDSPEERVLVIFGAGHLGWLQHNFASDPGIRLRRLAEFAE